MEEQERSEETISRGTDLAIPGELSRVGLVLPPELDFDEWSRVGVVLRDIQSGSLWWWGDWLNYGERAYGEKYAQALDESDYAYQTLRNAAYVANRVEMYRRRYNLSWGHHQSVAELDPTEADALLEQAEKNGWTVRDLRRARRAVKTQETPDLPAGKWRSIVADPPWPYEDWPTFGDEAGEQNDRLDLPYQAMTLEEITDLSVADLSLPDAHLFLWTTNAFIRPAFGILEAWGFEFSQVLTWCKPPRGIGPGGLFSNTTEYVLYGRRGTPAYSQRVDTTWWSWPRGRHSEKPAEFLEIVEKVTPGPYLELFARSQRDGWDRWGLEA